MKKLIFREYFYLGMLIILIAMFMSLPVITFGSSLLDDLFSAIQSPIQTTSDWTLYKIQDLCGTILPLMEEVQGLIGQEKIIMVTIIRYVLLSVPAFFILSIISYLIRLRLFSKFICFMGLSINLFVLLFILAYNAYIESNNNSLEGLITDHLFNIPKTIYFYIGIVIIGYIAMFIAKPNRPVKEASKDAVDVLTSNEENPNSNIQYKPGFFVFVGSLITILTGILWTVTIIGAIWGIPAIIFASGTLKGKKNKKLLASLFGFLTSIIGGVLILIGRFKKINN